MILWLLQTFCPLFCNVSCALNVWLFCRCVQWDWAPFLCTLIRSGFLLWSTFAKRHFLDERWKLHLSVYLGQMFRMRLCMCSKFACIFSAIMISLTPTSYLHFLYQAWFCPGSECPKCHWRPILTSKFWIPCIIFMPTMDP